MESTIKVRSTPNIMKKAFDDDCRLANIRHMKVLDFKDPEPNLPDDIWSERYGDTECVFKVVIRYPEVLRPLSESHIYGSWENVLRTVKKRRLERA